jgi:molybdopterin-guanine dinucleotide biosynthesis protein A
MGGRPKGLLISPDGVPLVERWSTLLRAVGVRAVLVGEAGPYVHLGLEHVADDPPGIGPLGGLAALLRLGGSSRVLALACDMPFVSRELIEHLRATPAPGPILAPKRNGRWEPLCARYEPARVLPLAVAQAASTDHSLQRLLDHAGAVPLSLSPKEEQQLRDWDTPGDVA